jgi:hypothetical protein
MLEKVMLLRLYCHLHINDVLYKYQFGFRHNHSTALAVVHVTDCIYEHLDKAEKVIGTYLDLRKAFDTVDHDII